MKKQILTMVFILTSILIKHSIESYCNIPNECKVTGLDKRHIKDNLIFKCLIDRNSKLRFNKSDQIADKNCKRLNGSLIKHILIRPKSEGSIKLERGMIDLRDIHEFIIKSNIRIFRIHLQHFNGFDLNLFDDSIDLDIKYILYFVWENNAFDFYLDQKKVRSCQDFIDANNSSNNNPRSIFQYFAFMLIYEIEFHLIETRNRICPLVFKNLSADIIGISGENSFYSKRTLYFSNESFPDLNSDIGYVLIDVPNVELDTTFLHPDVFRRLRKIDFQGKVKKIHPDVLNKLENLEIIDLQNRYLRSLMNNNGIEWLKNLNSDIDWDIENMTQLYDYRERIKTVHLECMIDFSSPLVDLFPEEDFCLYRDYPTNQLVVIVQNCDGELNERMNQKITCTYLWITRSYKSIVRLLTGGFEKMAMDYLLNSSEYKSIENCNFEQKLQLCNKSTFEPKHMSTIFELDQAMLMTQSILNFLSYILSIFGIVTNLLVIITISSKKNKEEFKDIKQYDYLRLNSICNCLILLIHMISWLNECIYPFQVFCPIIRKAVFMQWFKIIVEEALMTALQFMNNFTYIGFAFNRISLIGKDHNKLVKFMSDLDIKKYMAFSLFISIGFSVIKVFKYDLNPGISTQSYPISYEYFIYNIYFKYSPILFIFNFISDLLNHVVFLLINLAIDIGMIVKLRQTLNDMLEKAKKYSTKAQLEAKNKENENALNNAKSMIIWNTSLNLVFKFPSALYSLFYFYFSMITSEKNHTIFYSFYKHICIDADFCNMYIKLSDFLYFLCISIQLFFYKHYDKKFAQSFKRIFADNKSK